VPVRPFEERFLTERVANLAIARIVNYVVQIAIIRCLVKNVQVVQLREVAELRRNGPSQAIVKEGPDMDSDSGKNGAKSAIARIFN